MEVYDIACPHCNSDLEIEDLGIYECSECGESFEVQIEE